MWEVRDVEVVRQGKFLLRKVNMNFLPGQVTALLGSNGAGKSTLLKVLSGEYEPDGGDVRFLGQPLTKWTRLAQARRRAVLPQASTLSFAFPVHEVVSMGWHPHRIRSMEPNLVSDALSRVAMLSRAGQSYTSLSGGERQRTQMARTLVQLEGADKEEARGLLLDEPLASLDRARRLEVLHVVKGLARQGVAVVMVLHDLNTAAAWADHLVLMHQGQIVASGEAHEVMRPATIRKVFSVEVEVMPHPHHGCPMILPPCP